MTRCFMMEICSFMRNAEIIYNFPLHNTVHLELLSMKQGGGGGEIVSCIIRL